jgi:formylglycine-generating enzyme required for sulfatase activity
MKPANQVTQLYVPGAFLLLFVVMLLLSGQAGGAVAPPEIATVLVKGGCFRMGDLSGGGGYDEKPVHEVCVDEFRMGMYEVTESQWQEVMGNELPLKFARGPEYPATGVSWNDARDYIKRLNALTGKNYRLPTEAEWEYAARSGGTRQKYAGTGDEKALGDYACGSLSCNDAPLPVGRKKPNDLGLYDMSGNAWEWVQDRYDPYYYRQSPRDNPQGDPFGVNRVMRGGASDSTSDQLRTSYREYVSPAKRRDGVGFRLLLPAH